ncbi:hypothetical protein NEILACOT_04822 [Neisseria lactamica ATCC 23970]|uniref:Uncharacterized protein n=1 Tax=Neisseria lactamica ATCC 23970 TaxID=546265 RepID=D0WB97_NEILA|nr:hypothetical protein NEILACOT_04822 [Neisseria lactamica ATCC 23970]
MFSCGFLMVGIINCIQMGNKCLNWNRYVYYWLIIKSANG